MKLVSTIPKATKSEDSRRTRCRRASTDRSHSCQNSYSVSALAALSSLTLTLCSRILSLCESVLLVHRLHPASTKRFTHRTLHDYRASCRRPHRQRRQRDTRGLCKQVSDASFIHAKQYRNATPRTSRSTTIGHRSWQIKGLTKDHGGGSAWAISCGSIRMSSYRQTWCC